MLLNGQNLAKSYGPRQLFSGITLGFSEGERVGLIGANGSGKSTLLRIFAGLETPDDGELTSRRQLRIGYVSQEDTFTPGQTCADSVADEIDAHLDDHERHYRATNLLDRAQFTDPGALVETLSGGWRKRLAIVRQLAREPDLLLMDEPTNHLDLEGILWLESIIESASFATLIVSHDRRFLEEAANRIIELSKSYPNGFLSHLGTYSDFLVKREEFLIAQQGREQALASGVRREIEWLKRGAKARTTKSKGRIERAGDMMSDLKDLRAQNTQQAPAGIDFTASDRRTRKLIECKKVSKSIGGRTLFEDVSFVLSPGTKLGLLGPNGSGKSTLIRLLTQQLEPDSGQIVRADQLRIVLFDQHREQLDENQTLRNALSPAGETLRFQGVPIHVSGWARRFLFRSEQLDMPVRDLSGGERARVLIARLMLREADVLILDEPTNDLDIQTLDVLESSLEEFPGAVVLVTHDRYLLDRISTEILALDGEGRARLFVDLAQWENRQRSSDKIEIKKPAVTEPPKTVEAKKRLNWKEQKEFDGMEKAIEAAEQNVARLEQEVAGPARVGDHVKLHAAYDELGKAQDEVRRLYERWAELESKR